MRRVNQGVRTSTGDCAFHVALSLAPNESSKIHQEIAYDPTTCQLLEEVGTPTPGGESLGGVLDDDGTVEHWVGDQEENSGPLQRRIEGQYDSGQLPPPYPPGGVQTSRGYLRSITKDLCPVPCATVTEVKSTVTWDWDGSSAVFVSASLYRNHLNLTGWDWDSGYYAESHGSYGGYTYAYESSQHHFSNASFPACFGSRVHVYYSPQTVYGYKSGYLSGEVWRTKSGPACKDLLSFPAIELARTLN